MFVIIGLSNNEEVIENALCFSAQIANISQYSRDDIKVLDASKMKNLRFKLMSLNDFDNVFECDFRVISELESKMLLFGINQLNFTQYFIFPKKTLQLFATYVDLSIAYLNTIQADYAVHYLCWHMHEITNIEVTETELNIKCNDSDFSCKLLPSQKEISEIKAEFESEVIFSKMMV